jgi:hypothetical protein
MISDEHASRLSFAINRLNNLVTAKRTFIERMEHVTHLAKEPWQVRHTRDLIEAAKLEIAELQVAAHDIRFVRENV